MILFEILTMFSLMAIVYAYAGYPLVLYYLNVFQKKQPAKTSGGRFAGSTRTPGKLAVIITARNEAAGIARKLDETLALHYGGSAIPNTFCEIVVASDASDDGTDDIVLQYADRGVKLIRVPERGGKEHAQGKAVQHTTGDFILFTDVKVHLSSDALENAIGYFDDQTIGAVSSTDRILTPDGKEGGEGLYVRYEMWLRRLETRFGSVVGLSGSCFAVRRRICGIWRNDVPSDFALLIACQRAGLRGILADDVICSYSTVQTDSEEFHRKVRTVLRGITTYFAFPDRHQLGVFSWQLFSHKMCRWLVPWLFVLMTFACLVCLNSHWFYGLLLCGLVVFYGLAVLGIVSPGLRDKVAVKVPTFFVVTNAAIGQAWLKFLLGSRSTTWEPSQKRT